MGLFSQKVNSVVSKIPQGKFLTYKEVAKKAGSSNAFRAVGSIVKKNTNPKVPCHRVIKSDYSVGSFGGKKDNSFLKAGLLLKEGAIGVIPTDTIYGITGSALNKNTVEEIYKLKKRDFKKPMIILISDIKEIKIFGIKLNNKQKNLLEKFWPGKVSIIFNCFSNKFFYLHRGTNTLAFRLPDKKEVLDIVKISGPLIAPSANLENHAPATTIKKAKKYFGKKVFYLDNGKILGNPSCLIKIVGEKIKTLRHS